MHKFVNQCPLKILPARKMLWKKNTYTLSFETERERAEQSDNDDEEKEEEKTRAKIC